MTSDHYTYQTRWSPEDNEFVATCLEFPSLSWLDEDALAGFLGIKRLVAEIIEDLRASGEPIPEPLSERPIDEARVAVLGQAIAAGLVQSTQGEAPPFNIEEIITAARNAIATPVHL
ncbi:MAG: toxin-antitoxin system HicB family antitoxin [Azospirillum sp.]|nr:toxin-antitoxin system HicB family antitoxin [Azospirillum sp.]